MRQGLNDQGAFSLQKLEDIDSSRLMVRVSAIGEQLDIELLSMSSLADGGCVGGDHLIKGEITSNVVFAPTPPPLYTIYKEV